MVGATAALLFAGKGVEDAIQKVNWTVIMFFMGLFVDHRLRQTDWRTRIGCQTSHRTLRQQLSLLVPLMGSFSAVASSIVDNIPVAATLIPIVKDIGASGDVAIEPLWWTLIICCNLGGNGTPIGSISCVIAIYALKKEAGVHVGWGTFLKLGGLIMLFQVIGAIVYVMVAYSQGWIPELSAAH